jgi:hypothetical protein
MHGSPSLIPSMCLLLSLTWLSFSFPPSSSSPLPTCFPLLSSYLPSIPPPSSPPQPYSPSLALCLALLPAVSQYPLLLLLRATSSDTTLTTKLSHYLHLL